VDVHKAQGSAIAEEAERRIARLYAVEKEARGQPPDKRRHIRQEQAKPILDGLEAWLHAQLPKISGKTPLAGAIRYAITRIKRLRPYLDHGILELDTDVIEQPEFACASVCRALHWLRLPVLGHLRVGSLGVGNQLHLPMSDHKITRLDEFMPWRYAQHGGA